MHIIKKIKLKNVKMKSIYLSIHTVFLEKAEFIISFLIIFLMPQMSAFIAVGCLVFIDFFTGIWAALKRKDDISSKRMKDTVTKLVLYNVFILTCMIVNSYLITKIPFVDVALGIIATVETKSIFENIESVLGIKIISAFKEALHRGKNSSSENKDN